MHSVICTWNVGFSVRTFMTEKEARAWYEGACNQLQLIGVFWYLPDGTTKAFCLKA